jgi:nicotinamidase-related amidase
MPMRDTSTVALLVIDVQQGLASPSLGLRNNPQAESNIAKLLAAWRERDLPIVHIQHCSTEPDSSLRPGGRQRVQTRGSAPGRRTGVP